MIKTYLITIALRKLFIVLTILLLFACENPAEKSKENNVANLLDLKIIDIGLNSVQYDENGEIHINDLQNVLVNILILDDTYFDFISEEEHFDEFKSVTWLLNGHEFQNENKFFFFDELTVGNHKLEVIVKLGDVTFKDDVSIKVIAHSEEFVDGFKNVIFTNDYSNIEIDEDDNIWSTSLSNGSQFYNGIFKFSDQSITKYFKHQDNYQLQKNVESYHRINSYEHITKDSNGKIWFGNGSANIVTYLENGYLKDIKINDFYGDDIHGMIEDKKYPGKLLVATHGHELFHVDMTTNDISEYPKTNLPQLLPRVVDFAYNEQNGLWIAGETYSYFQKGDDWKKYLFNDDASAIVVNGNTTYIAALDAGIYQIENDLMTNITSDNSDLPSGYIWALEVDKDSKLYVSIQNKGIYKYDNDSFQLVAGTEKYNLIHDIKFLSNNKMVFVHDNGLVIQQ